MRVAFSFSNHKNNPSLLSDGFVFVYERVLTGLEGGGANGSERFAYGHGKQRAGAQTASALWAVHRGAPLKAQVPSPQPKKKTLLHAGSSFLHLWKRSLNRGSWSRHKRANAENRGPRKKTKYFFVERRNGGEIAARV